MCRLTRRAGLPFPADITLAEAAPVFAVFEGRGRAAADREGSGGCSGEIRNGCNDSVGACWESTVQRRSLAVNR